MSCDSLWWGRERRRWVTALGNEVPALDIQCGEPLRTIENSRNRCHLISPSRNSGLFPSRFPDFFALEIELELDWHSKRRPGNQFLSLRTHNSHSVPMTWESTKKEIHRSWSSTMPFNPPTWLTFKASARWRTLSSSNLTPSSFNSFSVCELTSSVERDAKENFSHLMGLQCLTDLLNSFNPDLIPSAIEWDACLRTFASPTSDPIEEVSGLLDYSWTHQLDIEHRFCWCCSRKDPIRSVSSRNERINRVRDQRRSSSPTWPILNTSERHLASSKSSLVVMKRDLLPCLRRETTSIQWDIARNVLLLDCSSRYFQGTGRLRC